MNIRCLFLIFVSILSLQLHASNFSVFVGASMCHDTTYIMGIYAEGNSASDYEQLVIPSPWLQTLIIPRNEVDNFIFVYKEVVEKYIDWANKIQSIEGVKSFSKEIPYTSSLDGCYQSDNNIVNGQGQKICHTPINTKIKFYIFVNNFGVPMLAVKLRNNNYPYERLCFYLKGMAINEFQDIILNASYRYKQDPNVQAEALLQ